jgi:hypothetical protein
MALGFGVQLLMTDLPPLSSAFSFFFAFLTES